MQHAIKLAKQIDYLGGSPGETPKPVKTSNDPVAMLRADLENERVTIENYRQRIRQAEAMEEFALSETLRAHHCAGTGTRDRFVRRPGNRRASRNVEALPSSVARLLFDSVNRLGNTIHSRAKSIKAPAGL